MTRHSPASNAEQPLELSNNVRRIAGDLAHASAARSPHVERRPQASKAEAPEVLAPRVLTAIKARRLRKRYFPAELFADPAWDMMLHLFHAELTYRPVSVTRLSMVSGVPATTAIRWINTLAERNLLVRRADPFDARRVFIELTPEASRSLGSYFAEDVHDPNG